MSMTKKKDDDNKQTPEQRRDGFKVIDFKPAAFVETAPQDLVENLDFIKNLAGKGKVKSLIVHVVYEDDIDETGKVREEGQEGERLYFWNHTYNAREILGTVYMVMDEISDFVRSFKNCNS